MQPLDPVADEIESTLRKAQIIRRSGNTVGADALIQGVIDRYPEHPEALVLMAEILEQQGKLTEARDLLAKAMEGEARSVTLERKHADLVLKTATRDQMAAALLHGDFGSMLHPEGVRRSPGTAAFFSMLMPGFGQLYNMDYIKGGIFALLAVLGWVGVLQFGTSGKAVTAWFWPSIIGLTAVYITAILDAAMRAGRFGPVEKPTRPTPPVDKPFE